MDITSTIIQLASGALGGTAAGKMLKNLSLGGIGNAIAGILGGGIGGQILALLGIGSGGGGSPDLGSILGSVAGGGVGGGVLMAIIGFIKSKLGGGGKS